MVDESVLSFEPVEEEELEALCLLASALARLFSYPDAETAAVFTDGESLAFLAGLAARARVGEGLAEAEGRARRACDEAPRERAQRLRRLFTALFYRPDAPVPLEGRRWVRRDPAAPEARLGEAASVAACYRGSGLRVRAGVVERADALPTELDFVSFLLEQELAFSHEGNGAAALVWKRRRTAFVERHLAPLARAVAAGVRAGTDWAPLRYWAALLAAVAERCAY